jgi:DNA-binding NarL/FixJ family response regulator
VHRRPALVGGFSRENKYGSRKVEYVSSDTKTIRVLAADDHAIVRQGIASLVNAEPDMELVAQASTGREAIEQFRLHQPDITLMDLQMPDMAGIEAVIGIRGEFPDAQIIVLTTYGGDAQVLRALRAGARGYLLKGHVHTDLLATIRAVHAGQKRVTPEVAAEVAGFAGEGELTPREIQILRLIAGGNANKEIGARLAITEETVKSHVTNILGKLRANDRTHAVTIGLRRGIIDL